MGDRDTKDIHPSVFGLDWAGEARAGKPDSADSVSRRFFDSTYGSAGDLDHVRARVLFLRGDLTPSRLVEQSIRRAGHIVAIAPEEKQFVSMSRSGSFDVFLLDDSIATERRLQVIEQLQRLHPNVPVVSIAEPGGRQFADEAVAAGAKHCLVRDADGSYLLETPDVIERFAKARRSRRSSQPTASADGGGESTEQIDITPIAKQVLGAAKGKKRACFIVLGGADVGSVVPLDDPLIMIGRDSACNMRLVDEGISRFHARVRTDEVGNVVIRDLDSTNGTYVDGERISERMLREGDKVVLGRSTVVKFVLQDALDKSYHDELYESSTRDALTGAFNRKYCMEKMVGDLSFARRHRLPFSFLIFDIDHFKSVNDTYGHQTGDDVLSAVSKAVLGTIRTEDVLGRYGGEEFAIIASGTDFEGGHSLAERVRAVVSKLDIPVRGRSETRVHVTVSVGVATVLPEVIVDSGRVVTVADENLYKAKKSGRNRVVASLMQRLEARDADSKKTKPIF